MCSQRPGGLGVIDLEKQNKALILKNLHKFFNKESLPWVDLVWEKHYSNNKLPNHCTSFQEWIYYSFLDGFLV